MTAKLSRRDFCLLGLAAALSPSTRAQGTYPSKTVTMIVPYTAGGASDFGARLIVPELGRRLGQTVVVENVGGAGGSLGVQRLVRAAPDGYTLIYGSLSETILVPIVNRAVPYKSEQLLPVALTGKTPVAFIARPDFPASSMNELIALLRKNPGKITYGSPGIGTFQHVIAETVKERTQTFMVHIPYRGGQNLVTDVLSGQIDIGVTSAPNVVPLVGGGRVKALGVSSAQRIAALPQTPALGESPELKGMDLQTWGMVLAPAGTPDAVVQRLNKEINEVLMLPAIAQTRAKAGSELERPLAPAEALAFYRAEREKYLPIASRIKPE